MTTWFARLNLARGRPSVAALLAIGMLLCATAATAQPARRSLAPLLDLDRSLRLNVTIGEDGVVSVDGYDSRRPGAPFTWDWGDGQVTESFFVATHTYSVDGGPYRLRVTAHYDDGSDDTVERTVRFARDLRCERRAPSRVHVLLPDSRWAPGQDLEPFAPELFEPGELERLEYVLDVAYAVQFELCGGDVAPRARNGQVVARAPDGYGCSLWFKEPAATACADAMLSPNPDWSSLFHEMAHNVTLNCPAGCCLGGRTDGFGSAVMSETLAQILQHVTAAIMADRAEEFGLSPDLAVDVWERAEGSAAILSGGARAYRDGGRRYRSWDDAATPADETFPTFMALAREFLVLADATGDLRLPTRRLLAATRTWTDEDAPRWQPEEAEAFRATFLVAAMSHALERDLRQHFRALGFPIDDALYEEFGARPKPAVD